MRQILAWSLVSMTAALSTARAETLAYGSRAGMEVTIVEKTNIDTTRAKITVKHTRENAIAYCESYVGEVTEQCIKELGKALQSEIAANCTTGKFTTLYGEGYHFIGPNPDYDPTQYNTEFLVLSLPANEPLDGSEASGYGYNLDQFAAMCPSRVK